MPGTSTPIFPQTIVNPVLMYADTNGVQILPFYTGDANGDKIEAISICNTDTNAVTLNMFYQVGGINYQVGTIAVPAKAGTDAAVTTAVDAINNSGMMPWIRSDSNGRSYIYLANGDILAFQLQSGMSSGKKLSIVGQVGAF